MEPNSPSSVRPSAHDLSPPWPSDEEFLSRFGDTIDDRIAEIIDDLRPLGASRRPGVPARSTVLTARARGKPLRRNDMLAIVCIRGGPLRQWQNEASTSDCRARDLRHLGRAPGTHR
jgi:hypothetical protein